jgi:hypothetical protein
MIRGAFEAGPATGEAGTPGMCSPFSLILLKKCFCLIIVHKLKGKFRIRIEKSGYFEKLS